MMRVAAPVLSLLLFSSIGVILGGQRLGVTPGKLPEDKEPLTIFVFEPGADPEPTPVVVPDGDCSFQSRQLLEDPALRFASRSDAVNRVIRWTVSLDGSSTGTADANTIPRQNFIDDEIFSRMASAGIRSAPLAADAEFLRRIMLDLTGRIPSAADVTSFLADTSTNKRNAFIDMLIASPEFSDKWTLFFGDLLQNNVTSAQVQRGVLGRDAFYLYLRNSIAQNKPYDAMARELIAATGDSFAVGAANWAVGNTVSMGPLQDTYDGAAVDLASMFMGINAVDCVLCHDGARHLDQVNLWGARQTRQNMWGLAAYFSRTTMALQATASRVVADNTTGSYQLNTSSGNRVPRPRSTPNNVTPRYPFSSSTNPGSGINTGETYRQAIARQVTADLQFSRAAVNYVWEKLMVEAFVSPSNGFDLARLDPNNPPPAPWTLQPTNPQLLDRLAREFQANGYNLRWLIGAIVKSSAYQLSSTYNGNWQSSYVPYYARKFVRRLDAEEVADAVTKATGIPQSYTFTAPSPATPLPPVQWAGQLPDTREPTTNGNMTTFLNAFGRGDRDVNPLRFDSSVQQALTAMNNTFVTSRIHQTNAGSRVATLLTQSTDPTNIIRQLYLNTLSRPATDAEVTAALPSFQQLGNRTAAENLQWVLLNRLPFLFNY